MTSERLDDRGLSVLSRQDRLAALEKMGLPDSARFSHATMLKIAAEADADDVIYGRFVSDGNTVTLEAHLLHLNPARLSEPLTQTTTMQDLLRAHARLSWQVLCAIAQHNCAPDGANQDESTFSEPPPSLRLEALQSFVQGLTGTDDEPRIRTLREAARIEPAWDRPAFELGQIYFRRRDCESALPWFSRVPPNRPDGPETSFDMGVCHLLRNDPERAEAAFSGMADRARSSDPKDQLPEMPEVHNNLGIARLRLGKLAEAASEFERATALDSEEPDYWVNLGIAKLAAKQPAAAVAPFETARNLAPDDNDLRALLISTLCFGRARLRCRGASRRRLLRGDPFRAAHSSRSRLDSRSLRVFPRILTALSLGPTAMIRTRRPERLPARAKPVEIVSDGRAQIPFAATFNGQAFGHSVSGDCVGSHFDCRMDAPSARADAAAFRVRERPGAGR